MKPFTAQVAVVLLLKKGPSYGRRLCEGIRERDWAVCSEPGLYGRVLPALLEADLVELVPAEVRRRLEKKDPPPQGRIRHWYRLTPAGHVEASKLILAAAAA